MNKKYIPILIGFLVGIAFFWTNTLRTETEKETIIFFPIDTDSFFLEAKTELIKEKKNHSFTLRTFSKLNKKAYLRQDITAIFVNGRLIGNLNTWEQNRDELIQEKTFQLKGDNFLQAITFHYAEIHDTPNKFESAFTMSQLNRFIINNSFQSPIVFQTPQTDKEKHRYQQLTTKVKQLLETTLQKGAKEFNFSIENYDQLLLTDLSSFSNKPFPTYSMEKTRKIIGQLWEGIYKNYFLSIKKKDGTTVSPVGSTIPIILLAKNKSHLLVLFETKDGERILLKQNIY